ncbi:hypothetical protein O9929_12210 [Vibrio lentus]|nr:hypothetical protein [Vibrio lentus]
MGTAHGVYKTPELQVAIVCEIKRCCEKTNRIARWFQECQIDK